MGNLLQAYYKGPDHLLKLRLLRIFEQALGRRRIVCRTKSGFLMALDQQEHIQWKIFYEQVWEKELTSLLEKELWSDDVFYDVGANVGYYSCLAACCGVREVLAFEPDPLVSEILSFNLCLNGWENRASVYGIGLSDKTGELQFQRAGDSGVSGFGEWPSRGIVLDEFRVMIQTLDRIVFDLGGPAPSVLKIDVEGWEERVLRGCSRLFRKCPPRLVLFEAAAARDGRLDCPGIHDLLCGNGYTIEHLPRADGTMQAVENYVARR